MKSLKMVPQNRSSILIALQPKKWAREQNCNKPAAPLSEKGSRVHFPHASCSLYQMEMVQSVQRRGTVLPLSLHDQLPHKSGLHSFKSQLEPEFFNVWGRWNDSRGFPVLNIAVCASPALTCLMGLAAAPGSWLTFLIFKHFFLFS